MSRKTRFLSIGLIAAITVIAVVLAGCAAPPAATPVPTQPPPAATLVPTQPPPSTSTPVPPPDPWDRIQKDGAMIVGTSGDYAPFEFYNSRYRLDGFDIELMREIGKRLGVKVDFKDMAFDGLYNAMQLERIDAAIAAISVTPERQQYVDFTDIYYVGQDGVLAAKNS
jgi:ABC-type amino acid transport substrate-binding protein